MTLSATGPAAPPSPSTHARPHPLTASTRGQLLGPNGTSLRSSPGSENMPAPRVCPSVTPEPSLLCAAPASLQLVRTRPARRSPPLPAPSPTSGRLSPGARSRPFTLVSFSNLTPACAHPPCGPVLVPAVPAAHGSEPSVTIALSGNPKPPVKVLGNHLPGPQVPPGTHREEPQTQTETGALRPPAGCVTSGCLSPWEPWTLAACAAEH